jgi:hypothetical protein
LRQVKGRPHTKQSLLGSSDFLELDERFGVGTTKINLEISVILWFLLFGSST